MLQLILVLHMRLEIMPLYVDDVGFDQRFASRSADLRSNFEHMIRLGIRTTFLVLICVWT